MATGQLVCFLLESEETSKPKKTYGILATNVRLESKFGTCLMATNKYQTFAAQDIGDAAKRWEIPFFGDGSPKSTLELLHKVSYNDTDVRNKAIKESEELYLSAIAHTAKVNAEVTPEENVSNPTRQYTKDDKILRKRTYPCSFCKEPADGVHQCGYCYCHLTPRVLRPSLVRRSATVSSESVANALPQIPMRTTKCHLTTMMKPTLTTMKYQA